MAHKFEIWFVQEMGDVVLSAREEIVQAQNIMALCNKAGTEMPTYEPCAARDENACSLMHEMGLASRLQPGKLKGAVRWGPGLKEVLHRTELIHWNHSSLWH